MKHIFLSAFFITCFIGSGALFLTNTAEASYHFSNYKGVPPIHTLGGKSKTPVGMTPQEIKTIYHLPQSGGRGAVVIVGAYNDATLEADLAVFSKSFNLPACTVANGCLTKHTMSATIKSNSGWAMETSLDVEWAHAVAPSAKIIVVEATTPSGANLLAAVDYAASLKTASAISMSWGGAEFPEEVSMDSHFVSVSHAPFFASSG
ncbi:MAG TPA: peptidase S8/S53 subtilisin kexin sedolisin, partial [Candidatus Paceibacterota bacterium]